MPLFSPSSSLTVLLAVVNTQLPIRIDDFSYGQQSYSVGGKAVCVSVVVQVAATANNSKTLTSAPNTNTKVTELYVEFTQVNRRLATDSISGPASVTGTYCIYSKLCLPADLPSAKKVQNLQVLTHGGTLGHTNWDIAPGHSYVDTAATASYATLPYDRLGTELSDHPNPVQVMQLPIQLEIAHLLVAAKLPQSALSGRYSSWCRSYY